ncbi:MAG: major facilitator superfamily 1 [Nocardioides sp.]|jgi:hypothetical protein|nr:major facilitator superfamily 1 [Nocardioides sp.]
MIRHEMSTSGPALAPLRERRFRWFFLSRLVNLTGTTMAPVALAFAVLAVSNSASALGIVMGAYPHTVAVMAAAVLAGMGIEVFGLGWNLAMQENVPDDMLARAYSYDMLGSFVAIPVGQLAFGPLASAFGIQEVLLVGGVVYVVGALSVLLSRSVRTLPRVSTTSSPAS